jgi:hypothetical protein|tara:strand:- start:643 stop:1200 length:558 start_codon:yes stop_codon:yes gene_type:complete
MSFNGKETALINFLIAFYKNKIDLFSDIIYQKTPLSLRLLDWLVTNYSKKYNIVYPLQSNSDTFYFNIYLDYKNQLKAYSKKFFDPFCRQKRLIIDINTFKWKPYTAEEIITTKDIVTTVGQLNFFRWFIENKVIDYALNNIELIDVDMMTTNNAKKKGKRTVLSPSAVKGIYTNNYDITIRFKP